MNFGNIRHFVRMRSSIRGLLAPIILFRQYLNKRYEYRIQPILNNLCDIIVTDPVIRLPEFQGRFFVDCRSDLFKRALVYKEYDSQLTKMIMRHLDPNRDVIDVGANVGFYSILFAKEISAQRVLAIEPTKGALKRLYKNIELNDLNKNIIVFEGIASNSGVPNSIKVVEGKCEYSTIGAMVHPSVSEEQYEVEEVSSSTLDDLVEKYDINPGFIKIDVEGSEHLVIDGARMTLEKCRPIVVSELNNPLLKANGSSSKEVIDIIKKYDYEIIDPLIPGRAAAERGFGDILCIPRE